MTDIERIVSQDLSDLELTALTTVEVVKLTKSINDRLVQAKVEKEARAFMVAILLLALHEDSGLHYTGNPERFLNDLNDRAEQVFVDSGREDLWKVVRIRPASEMIERQACALVDVLDMLREADILHVVDATDVLGAFFDGFMRHGNTSNDLGIVLTPRHICWFAASSLMIDATQVVYDPATGTGGLLVAAFNKVRQTGTARDAQTFARQCLFGAEVDPRVSALAFINMYFRGDGKHNLKTDSCFEWALRGTSKRARQPEFERQQDVENSTRPRLVSRVLMNPPFALKTNNEREIRFIDHALDQMTDGGLLFAILPSSVMYETKSATWRKQLCELHTIKSVVLLPHDLFYPVSTETLALVIRKGVPHSPDTDVLWMRIQDDGFHKHKGFRIERTGKDFKEVLAPFKNALSAWVGHDTPLAKKPGQIEYAPIEGTEFIPQAHLGVAPIDEAELDRELRSIYKSLVSQWWDMSLQTGGDHD